MKNNQVCLVLKNIIKRLSPFIAAVVFFVCSPAHAAEKGDAFIGASTADARTLMPMLASDSASAGICGYIFNGLVKYDKDLNLTGDLAERWEVLDGGLQIVFYLRKDVFWQDGARFTSRDVAFTYRKMIDPQVRTPYGGDFERVASLETPDDFTVRVFYKEPFAPALSSWSISMIPAHLLEGKDLNGSAFARAPVGTGPYKFRSWKTQEKIELDANERYFLHRPNIDRVVERVIPDSSTIFLELQTGGVDLCGLTPLQYSRQTDTPYFRDNYRKFRLPGETYVYLGYNLRSALFSDARVRRALNLAVDKEEIIKIALLGLGTVSNGPFTPQSWAFNPSVKPDAYDPAEAARLLKQAGWEDADGDGRLEKDGRKFDFTILTSQGNDERIKAAEIIQRRLANIGIGVRIKVVEWSVFLGEFVNKRDFDAVLLGWSLPREPDNYDIWHSSKTREGEFNFTGYSNPEVDSLLLEARRVFEQQVRKELYRKIQELIYADQPYMFLYVPDSLYVVQRRFREVVPAAAGIGYNFIDWWVPPAEQRYRMR
ncbi:MAG: peptide-binding protein [Candidatus Omnitrophota bacterium]